MNDSERTTRVIAVAGIVVAIGAGVVVPLVNQYSTQRASAREARRAQCIGIVEKINSDLPRFPEAMTAYLQENWRYCSCVEADASDEEFNFRREREDTCRRALFDAASTINSGREMLRLVRGQDANAACEAMQRMTNRSNFYCSSFERPEITPADSKFREVSTAKGVRFDYRSVIKFCTPAPDEAAKAREQMPKLLADDVEQIRSALKHLVDSINAD